VTSETETPTGEPTTLPTLGRRLRSPEGRLASRLAMGFLVFTVVLVAFSLWWRDGTLPKSTSATEDALRRTVLVFSLAAAPVMALVWTIAYHSLRHWRSGGDKPPDDGPTIRGNSKVVISWLVVSSGLTACLLIWGLAELTATTATASASTRAPLVVKVTGQRWLWSFSYPQDGGISTSVLVLPVDRPVLFEVTSTDVIHSFWLPEMGIKADANPAVTTEVGTTPTVLGQFNVQCAELCGLNHAYMATTATVMKSADFDSWIRSHGGVVGQNATVGGGAG
jgi:cytochrome c oxidase subunit 2